MIALRFAAAAALGLAATAPASALTMIAGSGGNGLVPSADRAVAITGGNTAVRITANLGALGLSAAPLGTASVQSGGRVFFPITGGDLNPATLAGFILHNGSGVRFTGGGNTLDARNFRIDTVNSILTGDVTVGATTTTGVTLFTFSLAGLTPAQITDLANPAISLRISSQAASAFTAVFGAPNLTGVEFGVAATAPQLQAVPEPATWAMLILGFGMIGAALRARRTHVRFA